MNKAMLKTDEVLSNPCRVRYVNDYEAQIKLISYVIVFFIIYMYSREILGGGDSFKTGDWLINYEGGFVRRGLIGHILYRLTWSEKSLLWTTFIIQSAIQLSITHYVLKIFFAVKREISWLVILFSPAFVIFFPLYGLSGNFRKEIIFFLAFCLLINGLVDGCLKHKYIISSLFFYMIAVFSHEISTVLLFYYVFILFEIKHQIKSKYYTWAYIGAYVFFAVCGFVLSVVYSGGQASVDAICQALVGRGLNPDICGGAIEWLSYDADYAFSETMKMLPRNIYYLQALSLALIPLFLSDWWRSRVVLLSIGFLSICPLFVIALDWGRWIHIYIVMSSILMLFDSCQNHIKIRKIPVAYILAYCCLWSMPHYLDVGERAPDLGMLKFLYLVYNKLITL